MIGRPTTGPTLHTDRKACYKVPPTGVWSQDARRSKALDEQKRRRAQKFGSSIDSSRQLDLFSELTLGPSDDEGDQDCDIIREGAATFAPLLESPYSSLEWPPDEPESINKQKEGKKKGKNKRKVRGKGISKQNQYADKCMYAELLEMNGDEAWSSDGTSGNDGLPMDLESGWVAVTPVPIGKRCLAVTHQSSGIAGVVPNTTIRSRVLGKTLVPPFPSSLPLSTALDCILDDNWRENGILHVLDVLKWKGQDIGDCETPFRFWWRDTRLAELQPLPPPSRSAALTKHPGAGTGTATNEITLGQQGQYHFLYPATFSPIPYHTDTKLATLYSHIIPLTRSVRQAVVDIPTVSSPNNWSGMDVDAVDGVVATRTSVSFDIRSDGLLLYVAQASYEPGTSPLSTWIPIRAYNTTVSSEHNSGSSPNASAMESPLNVFERLVRRRMMAGNLQTDVAMGMDG